MFTSQLTAAPEIQYPLALSKQILPIHEAINIVHSTLSIVQRRPGAKKSQTLLSLAHNHVWECEELRDILETRYPAVSNAFVLGPNGLASTIHFLMDYQSYVSQPVIHTGLDTTTRHAECGRLENALENIYLRLVELVVKLTIERQRYQIDPPGFREAEQAYGIMRLRLPVIQVLLFKAIGVLTPFWPTDPPRPENYPFILQVQVKWGVCF